MKMLLVIDKIEKDPYIPKLLLLKGRHKEKNLQVTLDLPEKLQDIVGFKEGEEVEVELSKEKISDVGGKDLYMHGYVLLKEKRGSKVTLQISIHGLMLRITSSVPEYSKELTSFSEFEKVYVLFRRK